MYLCWEKVMVNLSNILPAQHSSGSIWHIQKFYKNTVWSFKKAVDVHSKMHDLFPLNTNTRHNKPYFSKWYY